MMRSIRLVSFLGLLTFSFLAIGQETFKFRYNEAEMKKTETGAKIEEHFLGGEVARKLTLLKESYTFIEYVGFEKTERTVVEKPSIYYSIKKMSGYYKKQIKSGAMTEDQAREEMNKILDIALNIRFQDTTKLEDLLWKTKEADAIARVYTKQVILGN